MNMIEKVARALDPEVWESDGDYRLERERITARRDKALKQARDVMLAIREPTDAMVSASGLAMANEIGTDPWDCLSSEHDAAFGFDPNGPDQYEEANARLKVFGLPIFVAMIDAALAEGKEKAG